jgi:hypothetical protein
VLVNVFRVRDPRLDAYEILNKNTSIDADIIKYDMGKDFYYLNNLMF